MRTNKTSFRFANQTMQRAWAFASEAEELSADYADRKRFRVQTGALWLCRKEPTSPKRHERTLIIIAANALRRICVICGFCQARPKTETATRGRWVAVLVIQVRVLGHTSCAGSASGLQFNVVAISTVS